MALVNMVLETVQESGPHGAPCGHIYAAMMSIPGFTLDHFNAIEGALISAGKVRKSGHCLYAI